MRRSKSVKRRGIYFLGVLFFASAAFFYDTHANIFFKELAERQLGGYFPKGTRVETGAFEGGVFKNLVSKKVRVISLSEKESFDIERIEINYRFWYPLLGRVPTPADRKLRITKGKGVIDLTIDEGENTVAIKSKINHVKFRNVDIIAESIATIHTGDRDLVKARVVFKDIIVNYAPFDREIEISAGYDRVKNVLNITSFKIGDEIESYGYIRLSYPYYTFLKWAVINLDLAEYITAKSIKEGVSVSGTMNGNFVLKGPIEEALLSGHFDIQNGNVNDFRFDSVMATLKGKGPLIYVYDSTIRKEDSYITMGGKIDLSRLSSGGAFEDFRIEADKNIFVWEGWSVTKEYGDFSVKAKKPLDEDFDLSFKARAKSDESEEERFLGLEHKAKF